MWGRWRIELEIHLVWANCCFKSGSMAWKAFCSSDSPALNSCPIVGHISKGFPQHETNLLKAIKNVSASILSSSSRCMQRVVKHLKNMPHLFSVRRPTLAMKGPKPSMPVDQNGGRRKRRRAGGKSAILGMTGLALHF